MDPSPPKYVASTASQLAQPLKRTQRPAVSPSLAQSAYHQHRLRQQAKLLQQQQAAAEGAAAATASALPGGDTHDLLGQLLLEGSTPGSAAAAAAGGGMPPVTVLKKSGSGVVKVSGLGMAKVRRKAILWVVMVSHRGCGAGGGFRVYVWIRSIPTPAPMERWCHSP